MCVSPNMVDVMASCCYTAVLWGRALFSEVYRSGLCDDVDAVIYAQNIQSLKVYLSVHSRE